MVEVGPRLSAKTWEALKKLDKDQNQGVSGQELAALDQDGQAGLSDQELLAAGIAQEDIQAVKQELARKAGHDPSGVVFELPAAEAPAQPPEQTPAQAEPPAANPIGGGQSLKDLLQGLKTAPLAGSAPVAPPDATHAATELNFEDLKKSLNNLSANQVSFPPQPAASGGASAAPVSENQPEAKYDMNAAFAEIGMRNIESNLPNGMQLTDSQKASLTKILTTWRGLPTPAEHSKFDMIGNLIKLAKDQRLSPELLGTIQDLMDPAKTPLHPDLEHERQSLVTSAVGEIADPSQIAQEHKNTCAGTTSQILFASRSPINYLRMVAALASPSGQVPPEILPGKGTDLHRVENTLKDDHSDRTISSRLVQAAFMEKADDVQGDFISWLRGSHYDNDKDTHSGILPKQWSSGLIMSEITHLLGGLYGEGQYKPVLVEQPNVVAHLYAAFGKGDPMGVEASMELLKKRLDEGKPVPVGIRWSVSDELNFHALLVTRIDPEKNLVYFMNPHGKAQTMDLKDFQSRVTAMADPMEAEPMPGQGDALNRMPNPLNDPAKYEPIKWDTYRKLSEQLEQDPDLVRVLSEDQRSLIESRFNALEVGKQSLNEVMDLVKAGQFTHTMLDRLSNASDAQEVRKMLSLYRNLADSPLDRETRQKILAAYPERHLSAPEFSDLTMSLIDLRQVQATTPDAVPKSPSHQIIQNLVAKSTQAMQAGLVPGTAAGSPLDSKQILTRFSELRNNGGDYAYQQIAELASLADAPTKASMIRSLFEGSTPEKAERAIGLIIGNATPAQQNQILSSLDLHRLGNEMENTDRAAEILNVISKAGFDPATLESHMIKFFDGVDSQFSLFNGKDDDLAGAFVRRLDAKTLEGLPEAVKVKFFKALDSGNTTDQEYAWMRQIAQGSKPETKAAMIKFLMDQSDTNSDQENLMTRIILDTPAEPGPKGEKSPFLSMIEHVDARQLADELENDSQAGAVAAAIARASLLGGQKPIKGQLDPFLSTLAKQHREGAINAFIDSPTTQFNGRALYKAIAPETLKDMMSKLMDGHTSGALERTIVKILANTDNQQYGQILGGDKAFMARLDDELDSDAMKQIATWNQQYTQWLQERK